MSQAIASPSLAPQAAALVSSSAGHVATVAAQTSSKSTIIWAILVIALFIGLIFLFTKLNTLNKEVKELQRTQQQLSVSNKLLLAMAEQAGFRLNDKGEVEEIDESEDCVEEEDADENDDEDGVEAESCEPECVDNTCRRVDGSCARTDGPCLRGTCGPPQFTRLFGGIGGMGPTFMAVMPNVQASATVVEPESEVTPTEKPVATEDAKPVETEKVD
jgi:hypothetical protein